MARKRITTENGVTVLSSRASIEMVQKAAATGAFATLSPVTRCELVPRPGLPDAFGSADAVARLVAALV